MRRVLAAALCVCAIPADAGATSIARVGRVALERDARVVFTGLLSERQRMNGRLERLRFDGVVGYRGAGTRSVTVWTVPLPGLELGVETGRRYLVFAEPRRFWGGPPRLTPLGYFQGIFRVRGEIARNDANGSYRLDRLATTLRRARTPCALAQRGKAYFVRDGVLVPVVRRRFPDLGTDLAQLFRGPSRAERAAGMSTAIPRTARILGWRRVGRIAEIDVSRRFPLAAGAQAHLAAAQLVYTATQVPGIDRVRLLVAGRPTMVSVGGAPPRVAPPVPRRNFGLTGGRILVETPAVGQRASRPLCVSGTAVALSGRLRAELLDAYGRKLAARTTSLENGPRGERRRFELTFRYAGRAAVLVLFEPGAPGRVRVRLG